MEGSTFQTSNGHHTNAPQSLLVQLLPPAMYSSRKTERLVEWRLFRLNWRAGI